MAQYGAAQMPDTVTKLRAEQGGSQMPDTVKKLRPEENPFAQAHAHAGVRMNHIQLVRLGAHMPLGIFITLVGLFTYWYHRWPLVPWFVTLICSNVVLISTWPLAGGGWPGRDRWDWFPLLLGTLAVMGGVWFGLLNYANIELWVHGEYLHEYEDVLPNEAPQYVSDAGIILFAKGTVLDLAASAGYHAWPYTYCAAPIIEDSQASSSGQSTNSAQSGNAQAQGTNSANAAAAKSVGFWAVGINCCDSRGKFTCGDAKDADARAGVRVETERAGFALGHRTAENYQKAIRMAAAANNMKVADSAVMVVWYKDPEEVVQQSWWLATAVFGLLSLGAGALTALSHFILARIKRLDHVA